MREHDRRECEAFGRSPKNALRISLRTSFHALTATDEQGAVLAMFGVMAMDILGRTGSPWFLGTDRVFDYARDLMERGPRIIAWWQQDFDVMENIVSVENRKAIRLLEKWGAQIGTRTQVHGGVEFVPFSFSAAIQESRAAA
jgi:hypothetical protein